MDFEEALGDGVDAYTFFSDYLEALHLSRLDRFKEVSETSIIVCVVFEDTDQRFTFEFHDEGVEVEEGEMIDFPVATLVGSSARWNTVRDHLREIMKVVDRRAESVSGAGKITRGFLDRFERFDGVVELHLSGEDGEAPVPITVVLNDYEPPGGARRLKVRAPFSLGLELVTGAVHPSSLERHVSLTGDVGLAFDLAGFLGKEFPELGI